jgi:hypothetical protein
MATVRSLVVWGGLTGRSVTVAAATDLVTLTNHGLRNAFDVFFASGTLPTVAGTALALNTKYYAKDISSSTFELYYDAALTSKIDFTSTGSSLILKSGYLLGLDLTPWGSTRVYDGIASANSSRSGAATASDDDVIEVAEAFTEYSSAQQVMGYGLSASMTFTTMIDGVRSGGFHGGVSGAGYVFLTTNVSGFYTNAYNVIFDGLEFQRNTATSGANNMVALTSPGNVMQNCIVRNLGAGEGYGVNLASNCRFVNNIVFGFGGTAYAGIYSGNSASGSVFANNLVTKCGVGFGGHASGGAWFLNNLAVGNTINYGKGHTWSANRCRGNIGTTADRLTVTASVGTTTLACASAPPVEVNQQVMFSSTGTLPTVGGVPLDPNKAYFIRSVSGSNITIGTSYNGAALTFNGAGTGTHYLHLVWASVEPVTQFIDFTTPANVFVDWANNDFRPAGWGTATPGSEARQIDTMVDVAPFPVTTDILGREKPSWKNGAAEYRDVGPFEYDWGYGPRPATHTLTLTGLQSGVEVRCFTGSPGASAVEIAGTESLVGTSFSFAHDVGGLSGFIRVISTDYKIIDLDYIYQAADATIPLQLGDDPWFNNPA